MSEFYPNFRDTQPERELYTLTNLYTGEEYTVTMADMESSEYTSRDIMDMLNNNHSMFSLTKKYI